MASVKVHCPRCHAVQVTAMVRILQA
ncbi:hypothetical protein DBV23_01115 [Edwardsiella ictaluri]|nr:hypothetical protein B6E78_00695 [Edwardsiella ictaluri]AVZ83973.1 hypothetical protein DBV23_01115 [Edwardsiella ictaluri]EKS7764826.1 hypothetical protein [Edwardsiella ictaluri]EKS7771669.1 hypothetical protein [Edwardsiella ictaluri]EKS7774898.1 hypothetical protein [Edwardsiella ictaluri]